MYWDQSNLPQVFNAIASTITVLTIGWLLYRLTLPDKKDQAIIVKARSEVDKNKALERLLLSDTPAKQLELINKMVSMLEADNESLKLNLAEERAKITHHLKEIGQLKIQLSELKASNIMIEESLKDMPFPMWTKSKDGVMLWLNDEYERRFLFPKNLTRFNYIGFRDSDVWGKDIGKIFMKNDIKAREHLIIFDEYIEENGYQIELRVAKWPKKIGGSVVGVSGMVLEERIVSQK